MTRKLKYWGGLFFCLFLNFGVSYTQSSSTDVRQIIDSLTIELDKAEEDSIKIDLSMYLAYYWDKLSSDSAKSYIEQGLSIPSIEAYPMGKARLLFRKGMSFFSEDYDQAIHYLKASNELYIQEGQENLLYVTYIFLVELYALKRDVDSTFHYQELALKYLPENSYEWGVYLNKTIINFYQNLGQQEVALKRFYELEPLFESRKDLGQLGWLYYDIGTVWKDLDHLDSARVYFERSLTYKEHLVPWQYGSVLIELAKLDVQKGNIEKALKTSKAAIALIEPEDEPNILATTYISHAIILNAAKEYRNAIEFSGKSLDILTNLNLTTSHPEVFEVLVESYQKIGDYQNAFKYQQEAFSIKENFLKTENQEMLTELDKKYETTKQETRIELQKSQLRRQVTINWAIGIIAFLLLGISFLIWRTAQQRKHTNFELQQLDAAKSRFFANISHELRTPLTLIISPLENAIEKVKSKDAKENLQLAHSNGKKLLTLVNEILDLSKLESGKMTIKESSVHLEKLLRRIFFSYHSFAQLRGFILSFSYHLPEDLGVKLDVEKFEKVINNLLSNAFKYSNSGGAITLRASQVNGKLKIEVSDTGKGIAPDQLNRIFERFYQAENENEPLQGGTGIGLAYAREIALFFGGNLRVESQVGEGSTFTFTLPLKRTQLNYISKKEIKEVGELGMSVPPLVSFSNEKPNVLVVEDNPEMSKFLAKSLSPYFNVTTKSDGQEAMNYLSEGPPPDLITSDVMMPNMDGFSFLEQVHSMEQYRKTPIILLTARAMEEDKLKGFSLGVDDYLTKPFSTRELIARVHNLLKNKKMREEVSSEVIPDTEILGQVKVEQEKLSYEARLAKQAEHLVLENISNGKYKVADLAKDLAYSSRQMERILKKETGFSPVEFMREIRLQKAYRMLEERRFATIAEVRYEVGMENASHFRNKFRERFGKNPSEVGT